MSWSNPVIERLLAIDVYRGNTSHAGFFGQEIQDVKLRKNCAA